MTEATQTEEQRRAILIRAQGIYIDAVNSADNSLTDALRAVCLAQANLEFRIQDCLEKAELTRTEFAKLRQQLKDSGIAG
jgi:hypothetical protein